MTDTPPDRMSTNPRSPHFDMEVLQRGIGIRFKGKERTDVEEYSISEGWIRVQNVCWTYCPSEAATKSRPLPGFQSFWAQTGALKLGALFGAPASPSA